MQVGAREPPRGTQLTLGAAGTVVMSNLGYFQLPAAPGAFDLALRPGRSAQIYAIARPVFDLHGGDGGGEGGGNGGGEGGKDSDDEEGGGEKGEGGATPGQSPPPPKPSSSEVLVASWQGRVVRLLLERRPGMESEDVLEAEGGGGGSGKKAINPKP